MGDDPDQALRALFMVAQRALDQAAAGQYVDYEVDPTSEDRSNAVSESAAVQSQEDQQRPGDSTEEWLKDWKPIRPLERSNAFRRPGRWSRSLDLDAAIINHSAFCGTVMVQQSFDAIPFAKMVCDMGSKGQLSFWTDTSEGNTLRPCGYAVSHRRAGDNSWRYDTVRMVGADKDLTAMMAIRSALTMAVEEVEAAAEKPELVRVFSASVSMLRKIFRIQTPLALTMSWEPAELVEAAEDIVRTSWRLKGLGARLELHWVPTGAVDGSRRADRMARYTEDELSGVSAPEQNGSLQLSTEAATATGSLATLEA
ncbi:RNase H domain-containing protein [Purpureocillium lavendulum]|uniref:RNase H domain-containing protein n=1 Tax=Purpureocillium lavendulum TaxID=1247861 RepID=A0AB34FZ90_9HYPO|nr:RNase H domain-containing protein [Purpureocillium lavendulum]